MAKLFLSLITDLQMICGYTCEDLASMFKELKTLGVMVKDLSDKLRKVVRKFLFVCFVCL